MARNRKSISTEQTISGVGLHSGSESTLTFKPAPPDHGIQFLRVDSKDAKAVRATLEEVREVERRTTVGEGESTVQTIEHLMAAIYALGIDDLLVELNGVEPPIGDGSSKIFFDALQKAKPTEIEVKTNPLKVIAPFAFSEGDSEYIVSPRENLRLTVSIEWDHPLIGSMSGSYDLSRDIFEEDLAASRTFGFKADADNLKAKGLARGASDQNALVLSETGLIGGELRWPDEFVRHKAVDLLGDLALLGKPLAADVVAFRPSHKGNVALARHLSRSTATAVPPIMGIQEIFGALPHRYPMLLVDRIIEVVPGKRLVGIKNVTINEPFFQGHFPDHPVMPGVLVVEAMAQAGGMMLMGAFEDAADKVVYFMGIDNVKFRKPIVPGDQLRFELEMLHFRGRNCKMSGVAYVDGKAVAQAEMSARVVDR